jgi:hypothetical protein
MKSNVGNTLMLHRATKTVIEAALGMMNLNIVMRQDAGIT